MKSLITTAFIVVVLSMSACSAHQTDNYYDRANKASEKSLQSLDKE